ncbi:EMILIN-3 [Menidia menidia]
MHSAMAFGPVVFIALLLCVETKFYRPFQFHQYDHGLSPHNEQGKPTSRHKNHCAYVVEKTVSFTLQDGAAPYVKAEYNKCSWGHKCPTLLYRLMYKPIYKVAHKTVTELEWRCCPGYSGYDCMEGHPGHHYPMRMMPPFMGPPEKGPQYKGPQHKGPMFKGPPVKGNVKANPWSQLKGPNSIPIPHFGPPRSSSYPEGSFEPYPSEPDPLPENQDTHLTDSNQDHEHSQEPEEMMPAEILAPQSGEDHHEAGAIGHSLNSETEERIYRIEEDVRRLSQGFETLRGTLTGLEDSLRASLREDANRMLSALLSAAPGPVPAPATLSNPSTVGFVEIPAGHPEAEGLDGSHVFPGLTQLNGRVEELRTELQAKTAELRELKAAVMGKDGRLKTVSNGAGTASDSSGDLGGAMEDLMDAKLSAARTEILGGLEKRVQSAEERCEEKAGEEQRQCQREHHKQQQRMRTTLEESTSKLRSDLENIQAQIHGLKATDSCCGQMDELTERIQLLETSVSSLNKSQGHLSRELGAHKDHIEGMLEGRLGYVESKLNLTGQIKSYESGRRKFVFDNGVTGQGLETRMEEKLRALEDRLLAALEELNNATVPTVLEGHAVPTLQTELEALRGKLDLDVDRVQKHLDSLQDLCSSSCSSPLKSDTQADSAGPSENQQMEQNVEKAIGVETDRLNSLNVTVQKILNKLTIKDQQMQAEDKSPFEAELTVLKFNVRSVNHTLRGLKDSLVTVVHQVDQANSTWHDREVRLAQQIKGVVQLVGHQASMLGAGERRLARLKGELHDMKRRLAEEVRGCRSTALVVKKEVTEVGGRVASVEDRCKGLNHLADDLERIREELEQQSTGLLLQINGTLSSHAQQLHELKGEVKNCISRPEPTQSFEVKPDGSRGDTFTLQ